MNDLIHRQQVLDTILKKYRRAACDFTRADCIRLSRDVLIERGHKPPRLPCYRSRAGALRALKKAGFRNLVELFDSLLERIPPAMMLPGDIAVMPDAEDGNGGAEVNVGAAVVNLGNGKVLGWHEDQGFDEAAVIVADVIEAAWRV